MSTKPAFTIFTTLALLTLSSPLTAQDKQEAKLAPKLAARLEAATKDLTRREWTIDGTAREALLHTPASRENHARPPSSSHSTATAARCSERPRCSTTITSGPKPSSSTCKASTRPRNWSIPRESSPAGRTSPAFMTTATSNSSTPSWRRSKPSTKSTKSGIYSTGHSNGGGFTYLLWRTRGDVFAAVAPSAAAGPGNAWTTHLAALKPKPALHLAGEKDDLVKYEWQQRGMEALRKLNGCDETGVEWAKNCTLYPSKTGTPVVTLIHPGAHNFPPEAPALFVKFFKEHAKP